MNDDHEHCCCRYVGEKWQADKGYYAIRATCCRRNDDGGSCWHEETVRHAKNVADVAAPSPSKPETP